MHMTLEADYAVRIVEYLAEHDLRVDAKTISEQTKIPLRFLLKIMRNLVVNELVRSFKGAKGGYMLAKPARDITLKDVIESVEGPYVISKCQSDGYECGRAGCCLLHIYEEIATDVREKLDKYNFEMICAMEDHIATHIVKQSKN